MMFFFVVSFLISVGYIYDYFLLPPIILYIYLNNRKIYAYLNNNNTHTQATVFFLSDQLIVS